MTAFPSNNPHEELAQLIDEAANKELECRKFVSLSRQLFVQNTAATKILHEESEYRGHTGDSDLIVICEQSSAGIYTKQAYVWEIKAPQCYIFERCNNNRVRPTSDFIKAENQLLHYYEELKSTQFVSEFGLNHPENVKLGGILIGNSNTLVKGSYDPSTSLRLYRRAHELRQRYLYGHSNIKIMIWNDVLDYLKVAEPITKSSKGDMGSISLSSGSEGAIIRGGESGI